MPAPPGPALRVLTGLALLLLLFLGGLGRLRRDFTYRVWFRDGDPHLVAFDEFQRTFVNDDVLACVVHVPGGVFTPLGARAVGAVTDALSGLRVDAPQGGGGRDEDEASPVERVSSLANFDWMHDVAGELRVDPLLPPDADAATLAARAEVARTHEVPRGYLVGRDLETCVVFARLSVVRPERTSQDYARIVAAAEQALAPLRRDGVELGLTGSAAIPPTLMQVMQRDLKLVVPLLLGVLGLVLVGLFRSLAAVLLTFGVTLLSVAVTLGIAGVTGIPMNPLTNFVGPILIAIGLADCVHILATFRARRALGEEPRVAAARSLEKNLLPTFLTSFSTALGFFSLTLSEMAPIGQLGALAGAGTMVAWFLTVGLVPPLLARGIGPGPGPLGAGGAARALAQERGDLAARTVAALRRWRWPISLGSAAGIVLCALLASRNEINSDTMEYFADEVPLKQATLRVKREVGGVTGVDLELDSGREDGALDPAFLRQVDALQAWLRALPQVTKVLSLADLVKDAHRAIFENDPGHYTIPPTEPGVAQALASFTLATPNKGEVDAWMDKEKRRLRVNVLWTLSGSKHVAARVREVQAHAEAMGLRARVTGKTVLVTGMNEAIVSTYFSSILSALLLVSAMMVVMLRSLPLGLLAMVPNVIAPAAGAALLALIRQPIDIGTVLVSSVCLGIAVDDTIHFLIDYRRRRAEGAAVEEALERVLRETGPALVATTAVLALSFSTFAVADFTPNVHFGALTVVVMLVALAADLILMPALLLCREGGSRSSDEGPQLEGASP
ncbi:MAG: RND family transporter [Planctomycetota bacterium]